MLKKYILPVIILILALAGFKWTIMSKDKAPEIEFEEHVWHVDQIMIEKQSLAPIITLYGKVESSELLNAAAPAPGQVEKVLVKEGQSIEKGQLMLVLEESDFTTTVKHAQGKVNELKALIKSEQLRHEFNLNSLCNEKKLLNLSQQALSRAEKVKKQNLGSVSETDQAMQLLVKQRLSHNLMQFSVNEHPARMEQLQARLMQAEADLSNSHLALTRSRIIAPFNGIVAKVNIAQGDRVNNNEKLLSFYSLEKLEVRAKLPISLLHEIQQNLISGESLTGTATIGQHQIAISLERLSGEGQASGVDAIFSVLSDESQPIAGSALRIGSIAVVNLQRSAQPDLIKVPYQAMYGTDRLYKIVDQRLQSVKVKSIGEYQSDKLPQLLIQSEALNNGDRILSTHLPNAFSGLKVKSTQTDTVQ